jgi:hypothetical protein
MSEENTEIVRRYLEDLPTAREPMPEWIARFWDSDGDYYPVRKFPEARPCHGREEIERFMNEWVEVWERYDFVLKEVTGQCPQFGHGSRSQSSVDPLSSGCLRSWKNGGKTVGKRVAHRSGSQRSLAVGFVPERPFAPTPATLG